MNLKYSIILLAAAALSPFAISLRADDTENQVKAIRSLYSAIEDGSVKSKTFSLNADDGPEEGEMTIYVRNGKLAKIYISYILGDHGGSDEYYYYNNGEMVFAYKTDSSWKFTGKQKANGESETVDVRSEYRIYLHHGEIIRALKKNAESVNPKSLQSLIRKADNKAFFDVALLSEVQKRGVRLSQISTQRGWEQYLLNEL